jgi:hypothetical protein
MWRGVDPKTGKTTTPWPGASEIKNAPEPPMRDQFPNYQGPEPPRRSWKDPQPKEATGPRRTAARDIGHAAGHLAGLPYPLRWPAAHLLEHFFGRPEQWRRLQQIMQTISGRATARPYRFGATTNPPREQYHGGFDYNEDDDGQNPFAEYSPFGS